MDAESALEAVRAIGDTVPEAELRKFYAGIAEYIGRAATGAAVSDEAKAATETDPSDVREVLFGKLGIAHRGHTATVDALNTGRRKDRFEAADRGTIETEFAAWLSEEKLDYITEQLAAGSVAHVIASPNVRIDAKTYERAARKFGRKNNRPNQLYNIEFYSEVVSQCTPEELSGTDPENGNEVRFNVVFEDFDEELVGDVEVNKANLAKLKADAPFLEAPSRLKSLTYYFTLREARGGDLRGPDVYDLTDMRDYTVEPKRVSDDLCVPMSVVYPYGGLFVDDLSVQRWAVGRVLVG